MVTVIGAIPTPSKYLLSDISASFCCVTINHKTLTYLGSLNLASFIQVLEVKVDQSCPTLCNPMDYTVHGILQSRILQPFPSPGDLHNPGIEPRSPTLQADSLPAEPMLEEAPYCRSDSATKPRK